MLVPIQRCEPAQNKLQGGGDVEKIKREEAHVALREHNILFDAKYEVVEPFERVMRGTVMEQFLRFDQKDGSNRGGAVERSVVWLETLGAWLVIVALCLTKREPREGAIECFMHTGMQDSYCSGEIVDMEYLQLHRSLGRCRVLHAYKWRLHDTNDGTIYTRKLFGFKWDMVQIEHQKCARNVP